VSGLCVLVVDDEPLAREMVATLAGADPDVARVVSCDSAADARAAVARLAADIVLLDIQMPQEDGLRFAERLAEDGPVVVFITAFREHAAEAFAVGAVDYLLKPFSDARFRDALARAKRRVHERRLAREAAELKPASSQPGRLEFGAVSIRADEIVWVEAQDYYVLIHTAAARHLVRTTLASLEERLDRARFLRIHRGAIVNMAAVQGHDDEDGALRLTLTDGARVPVSRARRRDVERHLRPRL
jgi:two-component system LytT family response regulator